VLVVSDDGNATLRSIVEQQVRCEDAAFAQVKAWQSLQQV
jgi:hypothetical protein